MNVIDIHALTKKYRGNKAIHHLTLQIEENKITGLIGRNGAGKTTLLKMMAGFIKPSSGSVAVFGRNPFNNIQVSANMISIDDKMIFPTALNLAEVLKGAESFYPNWNKELAEGLFQYFTLDPKKYHNELSKGMKSTFNLIIGIASRCALTILDEPTSGMDSAVRKDFYRAILKDYIEYPRTIIMSSHLLSEVEDILEDILLIKDGQLKLHKPVEEMKELAIGLRGKTELIDQLIKDKEVIHRKSVGVAVSYVVVENTFLPARLEEAKDQGIELLPVSADDLCIYLTNKTVGGIDDVFSKH
ncbi:ABC transporter ATP-binding protein [Bacillus horti]|uniref:ABC-2 type transport system ATP-binding protein n=1 Tax=Caldalkalibacillus horti TaxID=77523 RepID=A0ABT9VXC4_9BACI|nr:ABC transporter ATP-binding protein [Bacillus horti]MDQ0165545.1 ABC-2 type transport system ATP-binding protein [Bacillus horti]